MIIPIDLINHSNNYCMRYTLHFLIVYHNVKYCNSLTELYVYHKAKIESHLLMLESILLRTIRNPNFSDASDV